MNFNSVKVKAVKGDFPKGEITMTFTVDFDEVNSIEARELAEFCDEDAGDVRLEIYPRQMRLKDASFSVTAEHSGFKQASENSDSELIIQAYAICKQAGYASVAELQRNMRIGYSRAAQIIEAMHASGLIDDPDEHGRRKWIGPATFEDAPDSEEPELNSDEEKAEQEHEDNKEPINPLLDYADSLCSPLPDADDATPLDDAKIEDTGIDEDEEDRDPRRDDE